LAARINEFKRTSDVRPDYLERKEDTAKKQYQSFMDILKKAKGTGWTSEQLNFMVGLKSIHEEAMDKNFDKLGASSGGKKELKTKQKKHPQPPRHPQDLLCERTSRQNKASETDGADRLQQTLDTRNALGKGPTYEDRARNDINLDMLI